MRLYVRLHVRFFAPYMLLKSDCSRSNSTNISYTTYTVLRGLGQHPGSLCGCFAPPPLNRKSAPPRLTGPSVYMPKLVHVLLCVLVVAPKFVCIPLCVLVCAPKLVWALLCLCSQTHMCTCMCHQTFMCPCMSLFLHGSG